MQQKSPLAILMIGIMAIGFLGYMAMYMVDSNPEIQNLFTLRDHLEEKFHLSGLRLSYENEANDSGIVLDYRPSAENLKVPQEKRFFEIAGYIFRYEKKDGYYVWKPTQSFVVINELKETGEEVGLSRRIYQRELYIYEEGLQFQVDFQKFLSQKFPQGHSFHFSFEKEKWSGNVKIHLPYEKQKKPEEELKKEVKNCIDWLRNSRKSFLSHLEKFQVEGTFQQGGKEIKEFKYSSLFQPGVQVLSPQK